MADKREYKANVPVFGSLAYDLDALVLERNLEEAGRVRDEQREVKAERRTVAQPRQRVSRLALGSVVLLTVMAIGLLLCYVQLSHISESVSELKSELNQVNDEHVALLTKYEQTYDLATIKETAEAAGMRKPISGQIEYIELGGSDSATVYRADSESAMSSLLDSLKQGWEMVVEYFR